MDIERPADVSWRGYSTAERDRRWAAVREGAAQLGLDCIFVPFGNWQDARYLTQMQTASLVVPTDASKPPIVVNDRGRSNAWIPEARAANRSWGGPMAQALIDAGMERARIGVSGLENGKVSHVRAYDGVVNYSSYSAVVRQLPNATFVSATDVVGFVRYVKSEEEIDCARRASQIAVAGIDEMIEVAHPGVDGAELYARVMAKLMQLGSEHHAWAIKVGPLGEEGERYTDPPIGVRLERGTYITNEVDAVWGGIVTQEDQPILLAPTPDSWKPVIELQAQVFEAGLERMKPGVAFAELIDSINHFGDGRGGKTQILMSGRGMHDDGPLITGRSSGDTVRDVRLENGNVFVWKPHALSADGLQNFSWGGAVVVRERGAEMLVQRKPGLVTTLD